MIRNRDFLIRKMRAGAVLSIRATGFRLDDCQNVHRGLVRQLVREGVIIARYKGEGEPLGSDPLKPSSYQCSLLNKFELA